MEPHGVVIERRMRQRAIDDVLDERELVRWRRPDGTVIDLGQIPPFCTPEQGRLYQQSTQPQDGVDFSVAWDVLGWPGADGPTRWCQSFQRGLQDPLSIDGAAELTIELTFDTFVTVITGRAELRNCGAFNQAGGSLAALSCWQTLVTEPTWLYGPSVMPRLHRHLDHSGESIT